MKGKIDIHMKKYFLILFSLILIFMLSTTGCENKSKCEENLTGTWDAAFNTLSGEVYSGDISFVINEDNSFVFSDTIGNCYMNGTLKTKSDNRLKLNCTDDHFKAPSFWDMESGDELEYEFVSENCIILNYNDSEIAFYRDVDEPVDSFIRNNNWLTNDGLDNQEVTYRLAITNKTFELYLLDDLTETRLIYAKDICYDEEAKTLSIVPDISVVFDPPAEWGDLDEVMQKITFDVETTNTSMTLFYNDSPIVFHDNLFYMFDSESDSFSLYNSTWSTQLEDETYFCTFNFYDCIGFECYTEDSFCFYGFAEINEENKTFSFHISTLVGARKVWDGFTAEMLVNYHLDGDHLSFEYNGHTIDLTRVS